MSGVLNLLVAASSKILLPTTNIALTSGYVAWAAPETVTDTKTWGLHPAYGSYGAIGSITPSTISGFGINIIAESLSFSSVDGSWVGATERSVVFEIAKAGLTQDAFTSLTVPGDTLTTASAAYFYSGSGITQWAWVVPLGGDDSTAYYCNSGTVTVT